eukprot:4578896-Prymnesium_polylepis.1
MSIDRPNRKLGRGYGMRRSTPACASRVDCASSDVTAASQRGSGGFPRRVATRPIYGVVSRLIRELRAIPCERTFIRRFQNT